ncbi:MAG: flagellin, partial [Synergistaceae bacterium]|nr:flagellin [Synergistaceae bacterium]
FTRLNINTAGLSAGDTFVINVAAAAKLDSVNTSAVPSAFESNENVSVYADLARSGGVGWDSSTQYRFANDATPAAMNVEGRIIDRNTGSQYSGDVIMNTTGFNPDSDAGAPGQYDPVTDADAYWILVQVNNQGTGEPLASGLWTSAYIQDLENNPTNNVNDYLGEIIYTNMLNGATPNTPNPYNASLIFDVLEARSDGLLVRIQGHIMDTGGNYSYAEDEEFLLSFGENSGAPGLVLFDASSSDDDITVLGDITLFPGLFFDKFEIKDTGVEWKAGDRFTASLTASGQNSSGATDAGLDEIALYSDYRGTGMPHSFRFNDGALANVTTDLRIYQIANNLYQPDSAHFQDDQVMDGAVSLTYGAGIAQTPSPNAATFTSVYQAGMDAGVAHYYSRLEDIKQFWDANGKFMLENGPESLTIKMGDREMTVRLYSGDELGKIALHLSRQMLDQLLIGLGNIDEDSIEGTIAQHENHDKDEIFQFVNTVPGESANEAVAGTFLAHSVLPGKEYDLSFFGSEDLLKALAFTTIQESADALFEIDITDAHSGRQIASGIRVNPGQTLYDVISPGVALDIDAVIGIKKLDYDRAKGAFEVKAYEDDDGAGPGETFSRFIHLADNSSVLQIGANEGENTILVLGDMTAKALGIQNLETRSREDAARSLTRLDGAIKKVSTQRAIIGAQINRLEHTIENLSTASTNLTDSRMRIKDADFAKEMMQFTRLNIISQAASSMLAQANQVSANILSLVR